VILVPPGWFLAELEAFDPLLRCRWSDRLRMWQIERRVTLGKPPECYRKDTEHDDYVRARDRFVLVCSVPKDGLAPVVFERLRASDLWAAGGWEKVVRDLEEAEDAAENKCWNDFGEEMRFCAAEQYESMKVKDGRTIYMRGG
jgi:hypothetical protein